MAAVAVLAVAPASAHAAEPSSWLVGSEAGVATAASAVPGARIAPGIRVVDAKRASRRQLRRMPGVRWVEPNRRFRASSVEAPTDPLFGSQWALQSARVPSAWRTTVGGDVTVAVLDSGIDFKNAEFAKNLWTNAGELPGNGADDDQNGYVDDAHGADIVDHDGDPTDGFGHGTAVASLIGARGDDGVGMSGVDWHVRLMPVKVLADGGWGTTATLIEGLRYALAHGARIVNMSVNGPDRSLALEQAIRDAGAQGALVVASAGNDGGDRDRVASYPTSIDSPALISVASSDRSGGLGYSSAYGRGSVDMAAPGADVLTANLGGGYSSRSGTSFAAAYMSGAAALLRAARPDASAAQLRDALVASGRRTGSVAGVVAGGELDVASALARLTGTPEATRAPSARTKSRSKKARARKRQRRAHARAHRRSAATDRLAVTRGR
ncbi:MAG TPA: S8 family peptidase [Thermoleophilaceae bacterium]|nr:S8 family peptidase [Thermoleophilaceae bacterium]